jgi:hypothetical protein
LRLLFFSEQPFRGLGLRERREKVLEERGNDAWMMNAKGGKSSLETCMTGKGRMYVYMYIEE